MAITLDITGVLQAAAFWVSNKGGSNGWKLYFYFYVLLTLLSVLLGNDPVILSGTVFLVYYTNAVQLEPTPWLISEFASANTASMVLFVGNPTNVVVCEGFLINNAAFTAYTVLPFLACNVFCFFALAFQFRHPKHIPRKLPRTGHLDPRKALRDPFGAWVGSIILGTCLVVIIVVSFFKVDVWMISLPFAVAKLIFDFAWDQYRHLRRLHQPLEDKQEHSRQSTSDAPDTLVDGEDPMLIEIKRAMALQPVQPADGSSGSSSSKEASKQQIAATTPASDSTSDKGTEKGLFISQRQYIKMKHNALAKRFPTFFTALPRLPFGLIPFAFSQFILIEALTHQGWIDVFAHWLQKASHGQKHPTIWLVGVLGVVLCNLAGTNIGATILLTKVVRAVPDFPPETTRAAGIALAVASNIGAVSFTFCASLAGLLWTTILQQKGIRVKQTTFAFWNLLPIAVMTVVGLAVVSAEIAVLYG
jgi:Na+/H+ antiporter NhaD/arsenite permease-like protein